jgi:hypothetical protein
MAKFFYHFLRGIVIGIVIMVTLPVTIPRILLDVTGEILERLNYGN